MTNREEKPLLGLIASEKCAHHQAKDWFTLNEFVKTYGLLLNEFRIVTTDDTKPQITDAAHNVLATAR